MNLLMLSNTYLPHVGGVARSVEAFAQQYRQRGHRVLIVAPEFPGASPEADVIRVRAIQKFNGSDFSVRLPIPVLLSRALSEFRPDIVHAHHPFLLGDTALRVAAKWNVPLVFTHHTMYERYTHYVPGDWPAMQRFAIDLSTGYANLCDQVIAPSESVAAVLRERGVEAPIQVVPTGVDTRRFVPGDGRPLRRQLGIDDDAFLVGHLGRLAPEKNLGLLSEAVAHFLRRHPQAHFLVVGEGPSEAEIRRIFARRKVDDRLHLLGVLQGQQVPEAYRAMDVFAFASLSETQGMVLTEAMSCGVPVVAIDAPGVREVVRDRVNGRLLPGQRLRDLTAALHWIAQRSDSQRATLREAALQTAEEFSMPRCADRALALYAKLTGEKTTDRSQRMPDSKWESALRLIDAEWSVWSNRARAAGSLFEPGYLAKIPWAGWLLDRCRKLRRTLSRNEWSARLLGLSRCSGTATEPGLVLIQIDGLSQRQLQYALRHGNLPFLNTLLEREGYRQHRVYSGMPSSTPAVQAELFFGVKTAVPSFSFRDHHTGREVRMSDAEPARQVQTWLAAQGRGLLEGGSAYSDIFSGSASESHFCAPTLGWGDFWRSARPLAAVAILLLHTMSMLRIATLLVIEAVLAVVDFFRGLIKGQNLWIELLFVPTRVGICILLRELITMGACIDATRGLRVIHVNFLGYDEQAHRRGPQSAFAHWSLKGIDRCIRSIWLAAHRSPRRDYQVWVYSDHGQQQVVPYPVKAGCTLRQAVADVLRQDAAGPPAVHVDSPGIQHQRSYWLGDTWLQRLMRGRVKPHGADRRELQDGVLVAAMGPIGHVYMPQQLTPQQQQEVARRLVAQAGLPLVLSCDQVGRVTAWNNQGRFQLPEDAATVLGADHPFLKDVTDDLIALCRHPDAGQLVVSGFCRQGQSLSFPHENGAHAGPGPEETGAFALLPAATAALPDHPGYLRPLHLREAALRLLGHPAALARPRRPTAGTDTLRIVTYNVHSCIGMDGMLSPSRTARMIAQCEPDIVALQELDIGRDYTNAMDQAHMIARALEMEYHFHPALQIEEEKYGNAVLSRFPLQLLQAEQLPRLPGRPSMEPRGAMCVTIDIDQQTLHLFNTHLGLSARERKLQVEALLSTRWLMNPQLAGPCILCGDFNALPGSYVHRRLSQHFRDAQVGLPSYRPQRTWSSHYPMGRIDHVFVSCGVEVVSVERPWSQLARIASDHLPLIVQVRLKSESGSAVSS